jgi:hypothetical protein
MSQWVIGPGVLLLRDRSGLQQDQRPEPHLGAVPLGGSEWLERAGQPLRLPRRSLPLAGHLHLEPKPAGDGDGDVTAAEQQSTATDSRQG